jgi:hypothetical protein
MDYNTLEYKTSRWNPFAGAKLLYYIKYGDSTEFYNPYSIRTDYINVSWDGGKNYEPTVRESLIDFKLYLSNHRVDSSYHIE